MMKKTVSNITKPSPYTHGYKFLTNEDIRVGAGMLIVGAIITVLIQEKTDKQSSPALNTDHSPSSDSHREQ